VLASPRVAAAFAEVPRERFIPDLLEREGLEAVYRDEAVVTKRDARGMPLSSSSQPAIMAKMLELLDLRPGQRVLEIGAGTGYNAALLSHIVGSAGQVTSVDVDPELARAARRALRDAGVRATVVSGDGRDGHHGRAPYRGRPGGCRSRRPVLEPPRNPSPRPGRRSPRAPDPRPRLDRRG